MINRGRLLIEMACCPAL